MIRKFMKGWSRIVIGLLALGSGMKLSAQVVAEPTDSVSIVALMEQVEKNTSYKIYTSVSKPFMVKKPEGMVGLEQLEEALKGTFWRVNVYGKKVFIMQDFFLQKDLPIGWYERKTEQQDIKLTEVLTSENKVYEIGDKFRPSKKDKIKLTGLVIDFKTNAPAEGIHVIRREPWTAVTTDREGRFEIELESGYQLLELQGVMIKDARRHLMLYADADVRIELEEQNLMLEEVLVTGGRVEAAQ